ncbi:translation initiation factor eIF-2B epsilon subunit, GEF [Malassezia vespertilionis]|uniref:Translation initiation factor eIF2B subunit epsilon n=1 Tax=Malassezia vespertilionis TaxID=2020962 RepID=A0A2N1J8T1_9BASI|nr:translation initiation factor eIF-2B epsilon subunit, GEF [Malassezia vespertilionis]PKI82944.1 hypothetical protein MVES_003318 [Malassezia vespertilionis]WFD08387.1 translation initiation factor eIF-2B epsilon subunit, GEF [Malassezia vespertilionis]
MGQDEMAQEDPLQAVVLCDAFNERFMPLTLDIPRCLMPICSVPMIEWTLESLAKAGVHEVFFLATWHTSQIRAYLEDMHPNLLKPSAARGAVANTSTLTKITLIAVPEAHSVGDAMRELDAHQVIKGDFILMQADAIGNMNLAEVVTAHKQRRQADRSTIMTICTMPSKNGRRARRFGDLSVFAVSPLSSQLMHYASVPAVPRKQLLKLPLELFEDANTLGLCGKGSEIDVRNDLVDCGVDICSIDVPPLFTENFDYQTLRRDYVQGILTSDLLEAKIFVHIAPPADATSTSSGAPWDQSSGGLLGTQTYGDGYMLRASDPAGYDAVNRDIITGWVYPYTPRLGMPNGESYTTSRSMRYVGDSVDFPKSAEIALRTVLGAGTKVGEYAKVSTSILGKRVTIGNGSTIEGSYLWDDVQIGANCNVQGAILGYGVRILDHVHIAKGAVIANGCTVGPDVALVENARVSLHAYRTMEEDFDEKPSAEESTVAGPDAALGAQAQGYLWPRLGTSGRIASDEQDSDEDDEDELDELERPENAKYYVMQADMHDLVLSDDASDLSSIDADSEPDMVMDDSDSYDSDDSDLSSPRSGYGSISLTLAPGSDSQTQSEKQETQERLNEFRAEAEASLERSFAEHHAPENAAIELKTLRMASNVSPSEVRRTVIAFVLGHCNVDEAKETADLLDHWGPLIHEMAQDDQIEALALMQSYCALHLPKMRLFLPLLKKVYNDEIVSDEAILQWWRDPRSRRLAYDSEGKNAISAQQIVLELRKRAEPVVRHIVESAESSEEESE